MINLLESLLVLLALFLFAVGIFGRDPITFGIAATVLGTMWVNREEVAPEERAS